MNRIILIGNGFDLAHGLPTSYGHFMDWYWNQIKINLENDSGSVDDELCCFRNRTNFSIWDYLQLKITGVDYLYGYAFGKRLITTKFYDQNFHFHPCKFLEEICKSIETNGWVDIENEYYRLLVSCSINEIDDLNKYKLNCQLEFMKNKLCEYLRTLLIDIMDINKKINDIIYEPFNPNDISISKQGILHDHVNFWMHCDNCEFEYKMRNYGKTGIEIHEQSDYRQREDKLDFEYLHRNYSTFFLPDNILLLNFNYTTTANRYLNSTKSIAEVNHIHGELSKPESVIFGYGDELDENYKKLSNLNDNEYLKNFKSIKYLESDRYRKALQFIESAPYQVYIMGHSCGNSDRTFLNTLFEHKNCVSIKPYYYKNGDKDNYLDIVQNISRNFKDMKLMRDRVVNKTYCEPFSERQKVESV